ncbi:hypothetical protein BDW59DRAFT_155711 [Aspergillus cavernicola]|uniref:DNA-directed RNA polymerase III subunit RPC9 n=1 Tax=Aspergillus cavernicola TaxID=176166 RepID=A0ABR4J4C5_9EURO
MRIINPQEAILTNIEVHSYLSSNPPRRPPSAPPGVNQRHWIPAPDLRDHNTVVKEIHNYITRLSSHVLRYPSNVNTNTPTPVSKRGKTKAVKVPDAPTALDNALRELVTRLQPYGLTKGEVLMLVNLGVGLPPGIVGGGGGEDEGGEGEGEAMDVDSQGEGGAGEGIDQGGDGRGESEGEEGEGEVGDYGALALVDTVIEEREQRLSDEDASAILAIVRETLGSGTG